MERKDDETTLKAIIMNRSALVRNHFLMVLLYVFAVRIVDYWLKLELLTLARLSDQSIWELYVKKDMSQYGPYVKRVR